MRKLLYIFVFCLSFSLFGQWTQIGGSIQGEIVSTSSDGSTIVTGDPTAGKVRVFNNVNGVWTQIGNTINGLDYLGYGVSMSGDGTTIVVGIPRYDINDNGFGGGQVRVYKNINDVWTQVGANINGVDELSDFGEAVSISDNGNVIAVGAPRGIDANDNRSGDVRVFEFVNDAWIQIGITLEGLNADEFFGLDIALSADGYTLAIGAPYSKINGLTSVGYVKVYRYNTVAWNLIGVSSIEGTVANDQLGSSVSLSADGEILAIGVPLRDINGSQSGQVRIYDRDNNGFWKKIGNFINGDNVGDYLGRSVSLSADGNTIACGGHNSDAGVTNRGLVRVFRRENSSWTQIGTDIYGGFNGHKLGAFVSLSNKGSIVFAGAPLSNPTSTRVRAYALNTAITDANFENYLETHDYDDNVVSVGDATSMGNGIASDNLVYTSALDTISKLNVNNESISSLVGIEDFTDLEELRCNSNSLTTIDITNNKALTYFDIKSNSLNSLDITKNTELTYLRAGGGNSFSLLDITKNTKLISLLIGSNPITTIDLSNNLDLEDVYFSNTNLTDIDLSLQTKLTYCIVSTNNLQSLNIKNGNNANITDFDATGSSNLTCIQVDNVSIPDINWEKHGNSSYNTDCSSVLNIENDVLKELKLYTRNKKVHSNLPDITLTIYNLLGEKIANNN